MIDGRQRAHHEIEHGELLAQSDPEATWGWASPAGRRRARRRAELLTAGARLGAGVLALEVGSGSGLFTEMLAETGARIVAVEISPALLAKAQARDLPSEQVRWMEQPFEACQETEFYDAVVGSSILHHLEVEDAVARIYRLLKPGGWMSFAEPNMLNPQIALQKNIRWLKKRLGDSPDETAFVRWRLHRLLVNAGFEEVTITPYDWLHPLTPAPFIDVLARLSGALERVPVIRELAGSLWICGRRGVHRSPS